MSAALTGRLAEIGYRANQAESVGFLRVAVAVLRRLGFFFFFFFLPSGACLIGGVFSIRFRTSSREFWGMTDVDPPPKVAAWGSGVWGESGWGRYEIPASETPEGQARILEYYNALGAFIDMFSRAEIATQTTLRFYSGLSANKAHILFSGTRADQGIDQIKKLAVEGGMIESDFAALTEFTAQLRAISTTRNGILHYGAQRVAEGEAFVEKALFGVDHEKVNVTRFPISTDVLRQMTNDLKKIVVFLHWKHAGRPEVKGKFGLDALGKAVSEPWQYKPPPQTLKQ